MPSRFVLWLTIVFTTALSPRVAATDIPPVGLELAAMEPGTLDGTAIYGSWSPVRHLSAEIGFLDLLRDQSSSSSHAATGAIDESAVALSASARLELPLDRKHGLFIRVGYLAWSAEYERTLPEQRLRLEADGSDPFHELGFYWSGGSPLQFIMSVRSVYGLPSNDIQQNDRSRFDDGERELHNFLFAARLSF